METGKKCRQARTEGRMQGVRETEREGDRQGLVGQGDRQGLVGQGDRQGLVGQGDRQGHVVRMGEERLTKRVWKAEVSGPNLRGRPRRGWMEGVERCVSAARKRECK